MNNKLFTLTVLMSLILFGSSWITAKAQTVTPNEAVITVSSIPTGTQALAVEITLDTSIIKLGSSATSNVSGALVVTDSMSVGVGIINTAGDLPPNFTITIPLEAVSSGTSMFSVGMVLDMIGGTEIAGAVASTDINSVTVGTAPAPTSLGTIMLIGTNITVVGPGKVAVAFSFSGPHNGLTAKLNGSKVDFISNNVGVAIIDIPASNPINLDLVVNSGTSTQTATVGNLNVSPTAAKGKPPEINSVTVQNKETISRLVLTGKRLSKTDTAVAVLPTNLVPQSDPKVMGAVLKAQFDVANCIPKGSYINLSTLSGTAAKKIKVHGKCSNPLFTEGQ